jgi:hypothetical protein
VLWCPLSVGKSYVQNEARAAGDKVLPVWIEKVVLPTEFNGRSTLDLSTWDSSPRGEALDDFFVSLEMLVVRPPQTNFAALKDYDNKWRRFGAPSLAKFALGAGFDPRESKVVSETG